MTKYAENKKKLIEEKELLLQELKKIGAVKNNMGVKGDYQAKSKDMEGDVEDSVDTAHNINSLRRDEVIITELETRLVNVDSAIKRIENNKYGICSECGETIEEKRLKVNPAASTCIKHMEI